LSLFARSKLGTVGLTTLLVHHGRASPQRPGHLNRALEAEVLLAVSDNDPQTISGTTREFIALHALAMHTGRPVPPPNDQAHIKSFCGHPKIEWPHLEAVRIRACSPSS
jgi:hypothetical protein